MPPSPTDRRVRDLVLVSSLAGPAAILLALALPLFRGEVFAGDDLARYHLPIRFFYAGSLERGESFDWIPQLDCGTSLLGEGQTGAYHPFHFLLYRFLPFSLAFDLDALWSYPFAFAGTFLFLRRWGLAPASSLFGSLFFAFSGFNLLHFVHMNGVAVSAHIPWLLFAIDVLLRAKTGGAARRAAAGVSLLTASQLLLGYPQYVWFSLLAETGYALLLVLGRRPGPSFLLLLLAGKVVGGMLGAIQVLPTLSALAGSTRASIGPWFAETLALHPANLLQVTSPYLLQVHGYGANAHESVLYTGAVVPCLVVWVWLRRRDLGPRRTLALGSLAFALFAFLLSLGKYGLLYGLQSRLLLGGTFRAPARHVLLVHLALAVVAALGVEDLWAARENAEARSLKRRALLALPGLSIVTAALAVVLRGRGGAAAAYMGSLPRILGGVGLVLGVAGLVSAASRGRRLALAPLALLAALDLGFYGLTYEPVRASAPLAALAESAPAPPGLPEYRIAVAENTPLLRGWRVDSGYLALPARKFLDYFQLASLRVAGVKWVRSQPPVREALAQALVRHDDLWFVVPDPLPRARVVSTAIPSDDPARDLAKIEIETAALVEAPLDLPPGAPGKAAIVDERPGEIRVTTDIPARRLLVVSESWHADWRAEVDDREAPVLRANGDFLGCVVEAGRHDVRLSFRPVSKRVGAWCGAIGGAVLLAWLATARRRGSGLPAKGAG